MTPSNPIASNFESCVLSLRDEEANESEIATVPINLVRTSELEKFRSYNNVQAFDIFNAAWSLTLFAYTGLDVALFGNFQFANQVTPSCNSEIISQSCETELVRIDLSRLSSVLDIVYASRDSRAKNQSTSTCRQIKFDTSVGLTKIEEPGATVKCSLKALTAAKSDLCIAFFIGKDELKFNASLAFRGPHISRCQALNIASTFQSAWQQIIQNPHLALKDVCLSNEHSLQQIQSWNCKLSTGAEALVHESIATTSRTESKNQAIYSWDGTLTYAELDQLSSRLAHHLVDLGAGPEVLVGICFNKSLWTVVAILAILKAGAAFVPLNPSHPKVRLRDIVGQTESRTILVAPQYEALCQDIAENVVPVTRDSIEDLPLLHDMPKARVTAKNTVYVIFTSGSTGRPKGVVIEHRAASFSIAHHGPSMNFGPQSRVLQFAAYTFDACIVEILTTLVFGGCICIPSDSERISSLAESIRNMNVNWAFFTPTVVRTIHPEEVPGLQTLVIGGEAASEDDITTWADKLCLIQGYGPTETTVFCTAHECLPGSRYPDIIGKALGGSCWIVDPSDHSKLTPAGARGELLMESPALMRGYLKSPQRTEEVLIEAPLWRDQFLHSIDGPANIGNPLRPRPTLYKTGDIVRFDSSGKLVYLGRKDTQIKLRGQRLELGEIEYCIKHQLPEITLAAVELVSPGNRQSMLAAFFCVGGNAGTTDYNPKQFLDITESMRILFQGLKTALSNVLPEYQIPSLYVPLQTLPLMASGKLDRGKLRSITRGLSHSEIQLYSLALLDETQSLVSEEPMPWAEQTLRELWSRALGLENTAIGTCSNFYSLGADSVSAMRLSFLARKERLSLTVADILRSEGNLHQMATFLHTDTAATAEVTLHRPESFSLLSGSLGRLEPLTEVAKACAVSPDQILDIIPCTPMQEAMMALSLTQPGAYVAQYVFSLPQTVDVQLFQNAWDVVRRNTETLHMRIAIVGKVAVQVVIDEPTTWYPSSSIEQQLFDDKLVPFNYNEPLNRSSLVEEGGEYLFMWTAHHAIYDGYSLSLLLTEVDRVYKGLRPSVSPSMASVAQFLAGLDIQAVEAFWKAELKEATPSSFPSSYLSPSSQRRATQVVEHQIEIAAKNRRGHTTTTFLRAAWALIAARYSNTDQDIVYGLTLSGRNAPIPGINQLLGPTITTIPFRVRVSDKEQTVLSFLDCLQQQSMTLFAHPGYEYLGLQKIKRLDAHTNLACNFQSLLVIQPQSRDESFTNNLGLQLVNYSELGYDNYSVVLECFLLEDRDKINLRAIYDPDVLSEVQLELLMHQMHHVFNQLTCDVDNLTLADVEIFSAHDREMLKMWNGEEPKTIDGVLHEMIRKQSQERPKGPAVHSWDGHMTFRELDETSDALAYRLSNLGVGTVQKSVPLCFEKSIWVVVAMLAVMKLGASFVPLSSSLPRKRLREICRQIADGEVLPVMLVSPSNFKLCADFAVEIIVLNSTSLENLTKPLPSILRVPVVTPEHAVYIIFTSGSTGSPKGVVIQHRALCTSIMAHGRAIGFNKESRTLQFCSYTFDVSMGEILGTLCFGGCVCIPSENGLTGGIAKAINDMQVNLAMLTPAVLKLLKPEEVPTLKTLVSGGEIHDESCIKPWLENLQFIQAYGPTECAIICMVNAAKFPSTYEFQSARNIGRGVGCRCWVVDSDNHHRLAPLGTIGELLIEGSILAKEYLKDAKKTSDVFIQNPPWALDFARGSRFYKTGDLVVQNSDGTMDFKGRRDGQVKLNGQRIEIGEIERHLINFASVELAAVFLPTKGPYKKRITAVVSLHWPPPSTGTSNSGYETDKSASAELNVLSGPRRELGKLKVDALRTYLSNTLPSYMVPKGWIILEKFPLNRSLKLDRPKVKTWLEAATKTHDIETQCGTGGRQPANEVENILQDAWIEVLQMPKTKIGVETSFMALGGDSITAIQVMWHCHKKGLAVAVRDILYLQTIAKLAPLVNSISEVDDVVVAEGDSQTGSELSGMTLLSEESIKQNQVVNKFETDTGLTVEDMYPCSPMQQGILISQIKNPEFYRIEFIFEVLPAVPQHIVDVEKICKAWVQTVQRHSILRTVFVHNVADQIPSSQVVFQNFEPSIINLGAKDTPDVNAVLKLPPAQYAESLPPHQLTICHTENGQVICKLEMSHAITDGSSFNPLISDLISAYDGTLSKVAAPRYRDYVQYIQNQSPDNGIAYWRNYLEGVHQCQLPYDIAGIETRATVWSITIPTIDYDAIQAFGRRLGLTKSTIFRTAWALCLSLYTGREEDTVFGFLTSGRDIPIAGIEDMMGPLMNMVVCRTELSADASLLSVLKNMQDGLAECLQHQSTPLAKIHRELGLTGENRLFNTILSYSQVFPNKGKDNSTIRIRSLADYDATEYSISVLIREEDTDLSAVLRYRADHISECYAKNIAHTFSQILSSIVADEDQKVDEIDCVSERDKTQVRAWTHNVPVRTESCVHELIALHSLASPSAEAVTSWEGGFTYRELDELSNSLAYRLSQSGAMCGRYVPILFEKSKWAIVAMVAVMKTGAAFCLIDPSHPKSRLLSVVKDLGSNILLTSENCSSLLAGEVGVLITVNGDATQMLDIGRPINWPPAVAHSDPAYVIYTSGSTGRPKGVVIEHGSYCSSAEGHRGQIKIDSDSRVLQFASYSFDTSIMDHLTTLIVGGCICVPSEYERINDITGAINRMGVNWVHLTPSVANLIPPKEIPCLKVMCLGGEAMTTANIRKWDQQLDLINVYGPSEASVLCVINPMPNISNPANIGKPVSSVSWVVNPTDHRRLVPVGAPGELVVEGPIVGRGYLNDAAKTSASFIFGTSWIENQTVGRAYKTGDLVKYAIDGSLIFIGRKDTQVKLHGQRIDLLEVEHWMSVSLEACGQTGQIAVELVQFRGGKQPALIGFIALGSGPRQDLRLDTNIQDVSPETKEHLERFAGQWTRLMSENLPLFMIPTLVPLQKIPITSSGKRDRTRLKQVASILDHGAFTLTSNLVKRVPITAMQSELQKLWAKVLHIEDLKTIGIDDNFFRSFGGDSMSAMTLAYACRASGLALVVADIFRHPVLADMALCMQALEESRDVVPPSPFSLLRSSDSIHLVISEASAACGVTEREISDIYPSTPLQEGFLAESVSHPGSYMSQDVFRLAEDLNLDNFRDAWNEVYADLPILRTRIYQSFIESCSLQVVVEDRPEWQSGQVLENYLVADRRNKSTFGSSLVRFGIVKEADTNFYHFVLSISHVLYDGWSLPMIYAMVHEKYSGKVLPTKCEPFNKFIRYLRRVKYDEHEAFWQKYLENAQDAATFPEAQPSHAHSGTSLDINHSITFERSGSEITTATIIQAAWSLLMGRYSNSRDVIFGSTLSGRTAPVSGIEDIAGPTISTVPIRVKLDPNTPVNHFLQHIQKESTDLTNFAHFGLQNIKQIASSTCDFQNLLVIQPHPQEINFKTLGARISSGSTYFHTYPLVMQSALQDSGLVAKATFDATKLQPRLIKRLLQQFEYVLEQLIDSEESDSCSLSIGEVKMVSPEDMRELSDWNAENPETIDACLHQTIADRAHEMPDKIALCSSWQGELTYAELLELSQKLAVHLLNIGVRPDMIVPVIFEKNVFAVLSMLAILTCGAAYVPISPDHPRERRAGLFNQVKAQVVLTSPQYSEALQDQSKGMKVVLIDSEMIARLPPLTKKCYRRLSEVAVTPDSIAYILFTSGSTGAPKGVVLTHRAVSTSTTSHGKAMGISANSRVFQFSSYTFDASIAEIFTALTYGSTICVPSEEERMNDLAGVMTRLRIDWSFLTPSVARLLTPNEVPTLRTLVLGGEAVGKRDIDQWVGKVRLMNGYGPTETCVFCVTHDITPHTAFNTIGRAVGSRVWIVEPDNHHNLTPIGAPGEMVVSSASLASGYLNDDEKSNKSFLQKPRWAENFSSVGHSERFYKTGDLVRYNEEGKIDFIARKDNQVKIGGQRIELGEVEYWIKEHELTRQVVVLVPSSGRCKEKLVAVVALSNITSSPASQLSIQQVLGSSKEIAALQLPKIQHAVAQQLPAYSMPTIWAVVEDVPLSMSTKVDRAFVSKWVDAMTEEAYLEVLSLNTKGIARKPTTSMEIQLQNVWSLVLGLPLEKIDAEQSFFQYGGDSISAIRVMQRCRSEGLSLTVQDILVSRGISDLAQRVENASLKPLATYADSTNPFKIRPMDPIIDNHALALRGLDLTSIERTLPCSHMQERILEIQENAPGFYDTEMVFDVVGQGDARVDIERLTNAWNFVVNRHEMMRTVLVKNKHAKGEYCQIVLKEVNAKVLILEPVSENDSELRVRTKFSAISDYRESGVPHRIKILRTTAGKISLKVEISHAITDGASLMILLRDLGLAYDGRQDKLAPAPSFGRHIAHLQAQCNEDTAYWRTYCVDARPCYLSRILNVPSAEADADFSLRHFNIDIKSAHELSHFCQQQAITVSNLFCTIWALVLRIHTEPRLDDIIFGYLVSGRDANFEGAEETIGPLFSALIFRMKLSGSNPLGKLLEAVRDDFTQSSTHQLCSMQDVERSVGIDKPLFNTMVNFRKFPTPIVEEEPSLTFNVTEGIDPFDYDLMLLVKETRDSWKITLGYWSTRIEASKVKAVAEAFDRTLSSMLGDVQQSVDGVLDSVVL